MGYLAKHIDSQQQFEESCMNIINAYQKRLRKCEDEVTDAEVTEMQAAFDDLGGTDKILVMAGILDAVDGGENMAGAIKAALGLSSEKTYS